MTGNREHDHVHHGFDPARPASLRPQPFRGPAPHGFKAFGWYGAGTSLSRQFTITHRFHGPRRVG